MPYFNQYDEHVDIDVDEFLSACDRRDIEELINALIDDGYIEDSDVIKESKMRMSAPEQLFEEALTKLHGKWNRLTKSEEEILMAIAKRF